MKICDGDDGVRYLLCIKSISFRHSRFGGRNLPQTKQANLIIVISERKTRSVFIFGIAHFVTRIVLGGESAKHVIRLRDCSLTLPATRYFGVAGKVNLLLSFVGGNSSTLLCSASKRDR